MNLESIIKSFSSVIALLVVYLIAAGMYLSVKGFVLDDDGQIVLARVAYAQDVAYSKDIPADLALPQAHSVGSDQAPVTLYEYSSFGCFHCADFHLQVLPDIMENYVKKDLVRIVFVPFPIDKASMDAALIAECVDKDKYFSFIDVLFKKQRDWGLARNPAKVLKQYAALSGLSAEKAEQCLHNDDVARVILEDRQNGITQLGIQGTPSFIVDANGRKELVSGPLSVDYLEQFFNEAESDDVENAEHSNSSEAQTDTPQKND